MAGEPWNRLNIPFPSAVSSVRIHFSAKTGMMHWSDANKLNVLLCYVIYGAKLSATDTAYAYVTGNPRGVAWRGSPVIWTWKKKIKRNDGWCLDVVAVFADAKVKALLVENEKVLKLIHSELLQTEIRVLYELLYILYNSYRGNKTFKCLQQVRLIHFVVNKNVRVVFE